MQRIETDGSEARLKQDFVEGMIRLGIWYVRQLLASGQIAERNVRDALTRRVNIYRLTSLWDGFSDPACGFRDREWDRLVEGLVSLVRCFPLEQTAELEERALDLLRPWLRFAPEPPPRPAFGCWTYEVIGEGITDGPGLLGRLTNRRKIAQRLQRLVGRATPERHAALHFFNACAPQSPFGNVRSLACTLRALIRDCQHQHPTVQMLWCQSWLNSRPAFLALFPETWSVSAVVRMPEDTDVRSCGRACLNTNNWWGQFMKSDGGFHEERGRRFRESGGTFPFPNRLCHARIDEVDSFLARIIHQPEKSTREDPFGG
jgi:hypothetical protein